ncbi:50S ribosomal protein L13 [Candidatus Saccharibacteria bacterium]|nr:50S ribosomal protein L13 [Candidatus Saccharibacteria bacterium]
MQKTRATKASEVTREWHLLDAKGKILGRLATEVAQLLMGKHKSNWAPYLDMGDYVVITNAREVAVTGKKEKQKVYYRHSGYPGGLKEETLEELRKRRPEEVIRHAVVGMLPKGKLGRKMITKLYVYPGEEGEMVERAKKENG